MDSEWVGLVSRVHQIVSDVKGQVSAKYPELFTLVGRLPGKHRIHLEEQAVPVIKPARRVLTHLREELKKELDRLEKKGIIARVEEPTDWVNQMVWKRK